MYSACAAATIGKTTEGVATVTSPAPARNAMRPARIAAPLFPRAPRNEQYVTKGALVRIRRPHQRQRCKLLRVCPANRPFSQFIHEFWRRTYLPYLQRASGRRVAADQLSNFRRGERDRSVRLQNRPFRRFPVRRQSRRHIHGDNQAGARHRRVARVFVHIGDYFCEQAGDCATQSRAQERIDDHIGTRDRLSDAYSNCSRRSLPVQNRPRRANAAGSRRHHR